jgi:LPXTG-site transpeptidase (sortase) family protein
VPDPTTTGAPARRHPLWVVAAGGLLVVLGLVAWWSQPPDRRPATTDHPAGSVAASARDAAPSAAPAGPMRAPWRPGAPRLVRIPVLAVSAPVVPVQAPGRTLVPPSDPQRLGWWADGARPGAARGSALITGHTVHTGGGALDDLEDLGRGDAVVVRTDRGVVRYAVDRVRVYSKGRIARDAAALFSQQVPGRLVLITCEDWDGVRYLSNVVVTATPHR